MARKPRTPAETPATAEEPTAGRMPTRKAAKGEKAKTFEFKLKVGRPTDYHVGLCEKVVELGAEGYSRAQMAAELGVCRDSLQEWAKKHPEFAVAIKTAADHALAWWEHQGRIGMGRGIGFNSTAWIFSMKNRFRDDYHDKVEHKHSGEIDLNVLRDRMAALGLDKAKAA